MQLTIRGWSDSLGSRCFDVREVTKVVAIVDSRRCVLSSSAVSSVVVVRLPTICVAVVASASSTVQRPRPHRNQAPTWQSLLPASPRRSARAALPAGDVSASTASVGESNWWLVDVCSPLFAPASAAAASFSAAWRHQTALTSIAKARRRITGMNMPRKLATSPKLYSRVSNNGNRFYTVNRISTCTTLFSTVELPVKIK